MRAMGSSYAFLGESLFAESLLAGGGAAVGMGCMRSRTALAIPCTTVAPATAAVIPSPISPAVTSAPKPGTVGSRS